METKLKIEKQDLNASPITEEHSLFFGKVFRGKSAYQYAVDSGLFSGTEEEFAEYLGNIQNVTEGAITATQEATTAKENAENATEQATVATANANSAAEQATTAKENAERATEQATVATANANSAAQEATTAKENAERATEQAKAATANANSAAQRANEEVDNLRAKADIDGNYPSMTVGKAENLVGRGEATEEYINFRQSDGEESIDDGSAKISKIKGNSVVWNNQVQVSGGSASVESIPNGWRFTPTGEPSLLGNYAYSSGWANIANASLIDFSHTHLVIATFTRVRKRGDYEDFSLDARDPYLKWGADSYYFPVELGVPTQFATVLRANNAPNAYAYFTMNDCVVDITNLMVVDLTKMFGAGNEPTTLEEYHQRKPIGVDTTVRNTGEILSNNVTAIKSVGENAFDYRVGYAKVLGGKTYNFDGTYTSLGFATTLDGTRESITLDENKKCTFEQEGYVFAEGSDICIKIQHSYDKPFIHQYQESEIRFDFVKTIKDDNGNLLFSNGLASIPPQRDRNGNIIAGTEVYDEIRYNTTTKKWEAIKRVGEKLLKELTWKNDSIAASLSGVRYESSVLTSIVEGVSVDSVAPILSVKYTNVSALNTYQGVRGIAVKPTGALSVYDNAYTDASLFAQSLTDEDVIYYELEEPIIVELDINFNPTYLVWDFGTEEAIASVPSAPFRADIVYQFNAVDRIRNNSDRIAELEAKIASLMQTMSAIQTTNMEE